MRAAHLPANAAATVSQPVHSVLSRVGGGLGRAGFFVTHLFSLERENTRLRQQLEQSRALAEQSAEWRQQAARLRELAKIQDPRELPGVANRQHSYFIGQNNR